MCSNFLPKKDFLNKTKMMTKIYDIINNPILRWGRFYMYSFFLKKVDDGYLSKI